ncbi:4-hydroxyphenyl-beta-ketoacyl-CoA hydrolase [Pseudonocardia sulfidoxydans NBRC 16205]|uniref:4-hydroxyphenyl-beta-ketoacyl-CoA hydrolase n=1 Tax=Pseudonocardia sulfidoxydans NBRC 16205 TaxID=1223511 RepID=A0A511DQA5_9PSEU|nr:amidohydrolase family protein [Pseudonocardia sulfidoxydans]GEL26537.1 4-hydroxyphenyl-beta-ketoacyl-CoA hydrolase [Pseudonocardia sulfidoxydans NBRC 16205]
MNLLDAVAIDVHAHVTRPTPVQDATAGAVEPGNEVRTGRAVTVDDVAAHYRARRMVAVVFPVDTETVSGRRPIPNDDVVEGALRHPDVLIPFASVDPWKGRVALDEVDRLIAAGHVRGFKFHPSTQAFFPDDRRFYPLYERIAGAGLRIVFHTGQTAIGARTPGGGGIKLKYSNPMHIDDVAADFPELTILMAHPSVPWQDEALAIAGHKANVYIDLSGWSPKYFPPQLVQQANTVLKDKVLFGSDYPMLAPDRWLEDFETAGFRDSVRSLLLKENAVRYLGLQA